MLNIFLYALLSHECVLRYMEKINSRIITKIVCISFHAKKDMPAEEQIHSPQAVTSAAWGMPSVSVFGYTQLLPYQTAEGFSDFRMSGNRGLLSADRICINIMPFPVTFQITPCPDQFPDKVSSFHASSTSSSFVRESG